MTRIIFSASVLSISVLLSACGGSSDGGASNDPLSLLSFSGVKPTEVSVNQKLDDAVELAYKLDEEDAIVRIERSKLPNSNIGVTGNIFVDLTNYSTSRVAVGDTSLNIDLENNLLSGNASNLVVSDVISSGTIANTDIEMSVDRIVYTTTGELTASGTIDDNAVANFGYQGRLAVFEGNKFIDNVTIDADGGGGFASVEGNRVFFGALTSDVTADTATELDVINAATIVWAK